MNDPTWKALLIALIAGLPGILAALASLALTLARIREVHKIVNSQRAQMTAEIKRLNEQLQAQAQKKAS